MYLILLAAAARSSPSSTHNEDTALGRWDVPFKENPYIRQMERSIGECNSRLCFVENVTILSTDDEQHRLSSKLVEDEGLFRVNIPNKAFGPVSVFSC